MEPAKEPAKAPEHETEQEPETEPLQQLEEEPKTVPERHRNMYRKQTTNTKPNMHLKRNPKAESDKDPENESEKEKPANNPEREPEHAPETSPEKKTEQLPKQEPDKDPEVEPVRELVGRNPEERTGSQEPKLGKGATIRNPTKMESIAKSSTCPKDYHLRGFSKICCLAFPQHVIRNLILHCPTKQPKYPFRHSELGPRSPRTAHDGPEVAPKTCGYLGPSWLCLGPSWATFAIKLPSSFVSGDLHGRSASSKTLFCKHC